MPPQSSAGSTGPIRDNRLEVFEDKRYAWDAHGNLLEKRSGRHGNIELCWDVEHQLARAIVTRNGQSRQIDYAYDAFGRRIGKREGARHTLFTWDGNRLLAERSRDQETIYLYEADSFAPLAQLVGKIGNAPKGLQPGDARAQGVGQEASGDEADDDWQPRTTRAAFVGKLLAEQRRIVAQAHGQRTDALPPASGANVGLHAAADDADAAKVIDLAAWRIRYYHNDHLGTPRELSGEGGAMLWRASYKAWGNVLKVEQPLQDETADDNAAPIEQPLRFQGQYHDEETGLHYNRFRYYDPDFGRFISPDPIGLVGGRNLYSYGPNAIGWSDPLGWTGDPAKATHITYVGVKDGKPYVGYASKPGLGHTAEEVLRYRYPNTDHFDVKPQAIYVGDGQAGKDVARGLEQRTFEKYEGLDKNGRRADGSTWTKQNARTANLQNPVGEGNARRTQYLSAADDHVSRQSRGGKKGC